MGVKGIGALCLSKLEIGKKRNTILLLGSISAL